MGVRTNFVQEEPLDLYWAMYIVEDVSRCLDFLTWEVGALWKYPPSLPEFLLIWRQILVHHRQEVLELHPLFFAAVICDADEPCT